MTCDAVCFLLLSVSLDFSETYHYRLVKMATIVAVDQFLVPLVLLVKSALLVLFLEAVPLVNILKQAMEHVLNVLMDSFAQVLL